MKNLARLLITLGIFLTIYGGYQIWLQINPNKLSFGNYTAVVASESQSKELPKRIIIPSASIDLSIQPSRVSNGKWETTNTRASYLASSPRPGDTGNSILYGHNWANLFGNLVKVKTGDSIVIEYVDGSQKKFKVQSTTTVPAQKSEILNSTQDKRITLYTCAGWFDEKRFVVVAVLNEK